MDKFSNKQIARLLRHIAATYLLTNENRFKVIAYQKAADTIEGLSRELKDIWQEGKLATVPSIGKSIQEHLDEYFRKGKSNHFETLLKKIPKTVFLLMDIPGIGPKKAYKLVKALNLTNEKTLITDLKKACLEDKVAQIETFGKKSQEEIKKSIAIFEEKSTQQERMPLPYAFSIAEEVISYLKKHSLVKRVDALGSLRRLAPTIGDIDIAVQIKDSISNKKKSSSHRQLKEIIDYFINFPKTIKVDNAGEKKASIIVSPYIRIDLRIEEEKSYGAMLQYFTGNKAHNIKLREYALKKGFSLSEYGIKPVKKLQTSKLKVKNYNSKLGIYQFETEENFYEFLGLQYIPPELREGTDEIEVAEKQQIPPLVELKDIKGDLHLHSSFDLQPSHDLGSNDVIEIFEKGKKLRYQYIGFSDHNPKLSLSKDDILSILSRRKQYIDKIFMSKKYERSNYFIGLEVDILPDGKIALPDGYWKYVDYLIISVHSVFDMPIKEMTKRVLWAMRYPKVKILGHPTGRMLGKREGFELEWEKIFDECRKKNIALEINAWPLRLDLPDILVREAIKNGVKLIINTDSHEISQMSLMFYGVSVARRGWAKKDDIINTMDYKKIREWLIAS